MFSLRVKQYKIDYLLLRCSHNLPIGRRCSHLPIRNQWLKPNNKMHGGIEIHSSTASRVNIKSKKGESEGGKY